MRLSHHLNRTWHHWSWEMGCAHRPGDQRCQSLAACWVAGDGSEEANEVRVKGQYNRCLGMLPTTKDSSVLASFLRQGSRQGLLCFTYDCAVSEMICVRRSHKVVIHHTRNTTRLNTLVTTHLHVHTYKAFSHTIFHLPDTLTHTPLHLPPSRTHLFTYTSFFLFHFSLPHT